jgi:hypothetical protein
MTCFKRIAMRVAMACAAITATQFAAAGDRLQWTGGVTQVEGSAGGGLVPWALIGGLETNEQIGASAFFTYVSTQDFTLRSGGASLAVDNRVEISAARQRFDAGSVVPGLTLGQDIIGLKVRLIGDAVFEPDTWLPQIAAGAQWKRTLDFDQIPRAIGAAKGQDVDLYLAATKLFFAAVAGHNVIVDTTVRRTRADQFGLLGFGGDQGNYRFEPEVSAALWLNDDVLLGVEYRGKPNDISTFKENSAEDAFIAWAPVKYFSITAAWTDLGRIAGKPPQRGVYVSVSAMY